MKKRPVSPKDPAHYPRTAERTVRRRHIRRRYESGENVFDQIALVVFDREDRMLPGAYMTLLRGMEYQASHLGISMVCLRIGQAGDWRKICRLTKAKIVNGFALVGQVNDDVVRRVSDSHLPWVVLGGPCTSKAVHSIDLDYHLGGQLAVQHLAQQGHRRIGFLAAAAPIFSYQYELRRGFCEAVRTLGLEEDEDLVRPREDEHGPDLARALKSLLNEKATAIVFGEPGFGPGYRGFISMAGITIPSDMALAFCELVPFDLTGLNAGLVHLAYERVGIEGVNLLKDLVGQPSHPAARILVKPSLVVQKGGDLAGQETVSVPHNERLQT